MTLDLVMSAANFVMHGANFVMHGAGFVMHAADFVMLGLDPSISRRKLPPRRPDTNRRKE